MHLPAALPRRVTAAPLVLVTLQVNENMMELAGPQCTFMHCLPAERGLRNFTDAVIESAASVSLQKQENGCTHRNGIMLHCLRK